MRINRTKIWLSILLSLSMFFMFSCVEEFWPELNNNDQQSLVVEGMISNDVGPYTITLSESQSLDSLSATTQGLYDFKPHTNATVIIEDDLGNSETLTETEPGIYKTSVDGIQGVIGRSYKLTIESNNGNVYESDFIQIPEPVEIGSVDTQEIGLDGYQFSVSTQTNNDTNGFFLWEVTETYEYRNPYEPLYVFKGFFTNAEWNLFGELEDPGTPGGAPPFNTFELDALGFSPEENARCWRTDVLNDRYIYSTKYLATNVINNFPLNFVPFGDIKLRVKYSLLVKQYSLSEDVYDFFKEVDEQNSFENTDLYTKQPYQIRGNMRNINDEDEIVLGMFYAGGASEKRIFAPHDPLPRGDIEYAITYCKNIPSVSYDEWGNPGNDVAGYLLKVVDRSGYWPVFLGNSYVYESDKEPEEYYYWFVAYSRYCIDCREHGGVTEKPDYWD